MSASRGAPLEVLLVEDSSADAALVVRALREGGFDPGVRRVETAEQMRAALDERVWDVVIADFTLPHFSGPAALAVLHQRATDLPFIVVSGAIGEDAAVAMMKAGAHDYLLKDRLARLAPAVRRELQEAAVRERDRRAQEEKERLLAREQKARAEAEAAIRVRDDFLIVAAHELKTPITSLLASTQLLCRQLDREARSEPDPYRHRLQIIEEQARRLARLVSQLLDVSRVQSGKLALELHEVDLASLVTAAVAGVQASTGWKQMVVHAPSPVLACVDRLRIEQVVINLMDNAVKFSPGGGEIEVDVSVPEAGLIRLAVRDHGIGIPPDKRERIFDRFHQAHANDHRSGLGLGLHISHEIVALHGGQIAAEFPPEGGTRFVVVLPAGMAAASPEEEVAT
jgi:signal transduction histidine kinase